MTPEDIQWAQAHLDRYARRPGVRFLHVGAPIATSEDIIIHAVHVSDPARYFLGAEYDEPLSTRQKGPKYQPLLRFQSIDVMTILRGVQTNSIRGLDDLYSLHTFPGFVEPPELAQIRAWIVEQADQQNLPALASRRQISNYSTSYFEERDMRCLKGILMSGLLERLGRAPTSEEFRDGLSQYRRMAMMSPENFEAPAFSPVLKGFVESEGKTGTYARNYGVDRPLSLAKIPRDQVLALTSLLKSAFEAPDPKTATKIAAVPARPQPVGESEVFEL